MEVDQPENTIKTMSSNNIKCKIGVLSRPDGSAFLCQGTLNSTIFAQNYLIETYSR